MLTTIAYQLDGKPTYALEGAIFIAGAAVQWLRDGLGLVKSAAETGLLAEQSDPQQNVVLVPAFVGLGAPYWDADCRGALYNLTRGTTPREIARATLESVGYQTLDLITAIRKDWPAAKDTVLRVDGGMVASDWTMHSSPISLMPPWTDLPCWKQRRRALPIWQDFRPIFCLRQTNLPPNGHWTGASPPDVLIHPAGQDSRLARCHFPHSQPPPNAVKTLRCHAEKNSCLAIGLT